MALITMLSYAEKKIIENEGRWKVSILFKLSSLSVNLSFLMDNIFCFVSFFLSSSSQGSDNVRDIPWPEELVFTVDTKIINEIGCTKELYYKKVKFTPGSLSCY